MILTDAEIMKALNDAWGPSTVIVPDEVEPGDRAIAQAQLDKAEPLIRRDERRKMVEWLGSLIECILIGQDIMAHAANHDHQTSYVLIPLIKWQALKKEIEG